MNVALWGSMWCGWCYITRFGGDRRSGLISPPEAVSCRLFNEEGSG